MTAEICKESSPKDDRGAALILAIVLVFAIGIVVGVIAQFATTATANSSNLKAQRDTEITAENLTSEAIALVRFDPVVCDAGVGGTQYPLSNKQVWCSQAGSGSRTVRFYACPNESPCSSTGAVALRAVVVYDDTPPNQTTNSVRCGTSVSDRATCGIVVTIQTWDVVTAEN